MVGSIASVENNLHIVYKEILTILEDDKIKDKDKSIEIILDRYFKKIRSEIFDLGNTHLKKTNLELDLYKIKGPYYKYTIKFGNRGQE